MMRIEESLADLARGIRGGDVKDLARRRAALEGDLEPMVRCALRDGTGSAVLVRWVRDTLTSVTGGRIGGPLLSAASYFMKSPPEQYGDDTARDAVEKFIRGELAR